MATAPHRRLEADDSAAAPQIVVGKESLVDDIPKNVDMHKLFADQAFMEERLTIVLHPGMDESEIGVPVSVNGDRVYLVPNQPMKVKRKHVAQLLKARPDYVTHRSDDHMVPEAQLNQMFRRSTSRYNFDVVEDTPKGLAWLREYRSQLLNRR